MPASVKHLALQVLRLVVPVMIFLVALGAMVHWQQRLDAEGCGRSNEACANLALARNQAQGVGFTVARGEPALMLEDGLWRLLLAGLTHLALSPAGAACLLGALCGLGTLLLGMRLAVRFGYHPMTRWFYGFALLFAPGWLPGLIEGQSTPLAALLVLWAVSDHVGRMDRHELPLSLLLAGIVAVMSYVRLELTWLWIIFALHYLLASWLNREPAGERGFILVRALAGGLLIVLALLPLAAWHWPQLGWPPLRMPGAPLATESQAVWWQILTAIPKAYMRWLGDPYWHTWALLALVLAGAIGLALRAARQREARSAFIIPLVLLFVPLCYALTYPLIGWQSSEVVFDAFLPVSALACAIAASRIPDWIARLLRRRYFLHAHWISALRVAGCLLLTLAAMFESIRWNAAWSAGTHALIRTRAALKPLLATPPAGRPLLLLTDQPGWALWDTTASVVDVSGHLTADFIRHRAGRDVPAADKLRIRLKSQPVALAVMWAGKGGYLVKSLGFEELPSPKREVSGLSAPHLYRFKRPPPPAANPLPAKTDAP
jgi:hypothetical protein